MESKGEAKDIEYTVLVLDFFFQFLQHKNKQILAAVCLRVCPRVLRRGQAERMSLADDDSLSQFDRGLDLLRRGQQESLVAADITSKRRASLLLKEGFENIAKVATPGTPEATALQKRLSSRHDGGRENVEQAMEIVGHAVFASANLEEDDTHEGHHEEEDHDGNHERNGSDNGSDNGSGTAESGRSGDVVEQHSRRSSYGLHSSGRAALSNLGSMYELLSSQLAATTTTSATTSASLTVRRRLDQVIIL